MTDLCEKVNYIIFNINTYLFNKSIRNSNFVFNYLIKILDFYIINRENIVKLF